MAKTPVVQEGTLIDYVAARLRLGWWQFIAAAIGLLLGSLVGACWLDNDFRIFQDADWLRACLTSSSVIVYILIANHFGAEASRASTAAMSRLLGIDRPAFHQLTASSSPTLRQQAIAFGVGVVIALLLGAPSLLSSFSWLGTFLSLTQLLNLGLLAMIVYVVVAESKMTSKFHSRLRQINLFDTTPFEVLGKSALYTALTMMGGVTLAVILLPTRFLLNFFTLAIQVIIVSVTIVMFFANLYSLHQAMFAAKQRELDAVRERLASAFALMKERGTLENPAAVQTWLAYEKRLLEVPEWPFNPDTLKSLFASVFFPAGAFVVRWWLGQP
jgi:hypothetical protein